MWSLVRVQTEKPTTPEYLRMCIRCTNSDAMSVEAAQSYGFGIARDGDKVIGYYTRGQAARPFMYPALKNNEGEIIRRLSADLRKEVRKL